MPEGTHLLVDDPSYSVTCFPVDHRIQCHGFLVERKTRGRKLLPDKCNEYGIPATFYESLKQGEDYIAEDGTVIKNELVTEEGPSVKRYAYCADTLFTDNFLSVIQGVDTLYHECTYLERDADKATRRYHSTAAQAAQLAKMANAKQLLLGHFSSKYKDV